MKTIEIKLYDFNELSEKAKEKAKAQWYECEDYPFLEDDLIESCQEYLRQAKVKFQDIAVLYSLGYSQGDGLCFTGTISKGKNSLVLTHNYRYYFATSVTMTFYKNGEEVDENEELKNIYLDTCRQLEKEGYDILEYRMDDDEFSEHCEVNGYTFEENGTMHNA